MSKGEAAARLVETALEMLAEDPGFLLINGLRGEDVCLRANISQTTFYRHYNKNSFIDAVAAHLVPAPTGSAREALGQVVGSFVDSAVDPRTEIRKRSATYFQSMRDDPNTTRRLLAIALGSSRPETRTALRLAYAGGDAIRVDVLRALLESWGAALRAPFTLQQVAAAITAVTEGFMLRWRVDPDAVNETLFGHVALALVAAVVDTEQRGEHIDDVASAFAAGIEESRGSGSAQGLPADPRTALVNAARQEIALRGYVLTTVDAIATRAKVPAPLAKKLFPTKQHIVAHALTRPVAKLREAVADDRAIGHVPIEVIDRHLLRLARFVHDERELVDALIAILSNDARTDSAGILDMRALIDLPDLITDVVADAQIEGVLIDKIGSRELAEALTDNLLVRCFNRRDEPADASARFVRDVVLTGALPR